MPDHPPGTGPVIRAVGSAAFDDLRRGNVALQHIGIRGGLMVHVHVHVVPPLRLVIEAPHLHAALVSGTVFVQDGLHPLRGEGGSDRLVHVVRIVDDLVAIGEHAQTAIGIVRIRLLLRAILRHAVAAAQRHVEQQGLARNQFRRPVEHRDSAKAERAGPQVLLVKQVECRVDAISHHVGGEVPVAVVVLYIELPVIAGGVIAAPAAHADAHGFGHSAVGPHVGSIVVRGPLIDAVYQRADRMAADSGIHGECRCGLGP